MWSHFRGFRNSLERSDVVKAAVADRLKNQRTGAVVVLKPPIRQKGSQDGKFLDPREAYSELVP